MTELLFVFLSVTYRFLTWGGVTVKHVTCCGIRRQDPAWGPVLGLVAQMMLGSGPDSDDSNQMLHKTYQTFLGHSFIAKKSYS
jgi:hypothetical protein